MSACGKCGKETRTNDKFCKACGSNLTGAQDPALNDKKARVMVQERKWQKPAVIAAAVFALVGVLWFAKGMYMKTKMGGRAMYAPQRDGSIRLAKAVAVQNEGGDVRIPVATVTDGSAHFFAYSAQGRTITFFVMKAEDGSIRTAYDACMACNHAKLGYRQEGHSVVCNNCGMGFKPTEIGASTGGCNPIPIQRSIDGQMVVLKAKDLEAGAQYF